MNGSCDKDNKTRTVSSINYVDVSFVYNPSRTIIITQIAGSEMVIPQPDNYTSYTIVNSRRKYQILYNWISGNSNIPLLVPNNDISYSAFYCDVDIPNSQIIIDYDEQEGQSMATSFTLVSDYPLYFRGTTEENNIKKDVFIDSVCSIRSDGRYEHQMDFTVSNADVEAGGQKEYDITMKLYKDLICSKCLGTITINVKAISTIGPGE